MKIILFLLSLTVLLTFTACGSKVPFVLEKPMDNSALVYVYVPVNVSTSPTSYAIRINNKPTSQRVEEGEFLSFNLKPQSMSISATKQEIIESVLKLNLKSGEIYYLKIVDDTQEGVFEFSEVEHTLGLKEILKTGKAGTNVEEADNIINIFADDDDAKDKTTKATVVQGSNTQMDEINKAYEMKEKGILSDAEFKAIKANILNK